MTGDPEVVELLEELPEGAVVHVDARVFALYLLGHKSIGDQVDAVMKVAGSGDLSVQTSVVTLYQILAEVYRCGRPDLAAEVAKILEVHPRVSLVPATTDVTIQAAEVRAQLGGGPERAIQIATALRKGAKAYLTTGSGLRRIAGMSVFNLEA